MNKTYLVIHMHEIYQVGHHDDLFDQLLRDKLHDGEIITTIMQDNLPAEKVEARIKEIVQDRTDVIAMLVYADYGYEMLTQPSDLVFMASLSTSITGNRATSIAYTFSNLGRKRKPVFIFYGEV